MRSVQKSSPTAMDLSGLSRRPLSVSSACVPVPSAASSVLRLYQYPAARPLRSSAARPQPAGPAAGASWPRRSPLGASAPSALGALQGAVDKGLPAATSAGEAGGRPADGARGPAGAAGGTAGKVALFFLYSPPRAERIW